jgi:hypothetical protein
MGLELRCFQMYLIILNLARKILVIPSPFVKSEIFIFRLCVCGGLSSFPCAAAAVVEIRRLRKLEGIALFQAMALKYRPVDFQTLPGTTRSTYTACQPEYNEERPAYQPRIKNLGDLFTSCRCATRSLGEQRTIRVFSARCLRLPRQMHSHQSTADENL